MYESIFQQTADWQLERMGKFTASEVGKLMKKGRSAKDYFGETAQTYIKGKLAEILTQEPLTDLEGLKAIEWGNANEIDAVMMFEKRYNVTVEYFGKGNPQFLPYEPLADWAGGSPDGLIEDAVIEVKAPYNSAHHIKHLLISDGQSMKEDLPEYFAQVQFNMMCAKKKKAYFISYDPRILDYNLRLYVVQVPLDEEFAKELDERIHEAVKMLKVYKDCIIPPVIVAERDSEVNATIVS